MSIDAPFSTLAAIAMDILGLFSEIEYMTFDWTDGTAVQLQTGACHYSIVGMVDEPVS